MKVHSVRVEPQTDEGSRPGLIAPGLVFATTIRRVIERGGCDLKHEQLLWERFLKFLWWDSKTVDGKLQFLDKVTAGTRIFRQPPAIDLGSRFSSSTKY